MAACIQCKGRWSNISHERDSSPEPGDGMLSFPLPAFVCRDGHLRWDTAADAIDSDVLHRR